MKLVVNPKYENLRPFLLQVLQRGYKVEKIYSNTRNIVEQCSEQGVELVVKIFNKPTDFNRVIYTFFRPSKAKRAYEYSLKLRELGFEAPEPVAYMEEPRCGFFYTGCYVSVNAAEYSPVSDFLSYDFENPLQRQKLTALADALASLAYRLHSKHIMYNDFNESNILYKECEGSFEFKIVDLNRMRFGVNSKECFAKDLSNLGFRRDMMEKIVAIYCSKMGYDYQTFFAKVQKHKHRWQRHYNIKHKWKL